MIQTRPFAWLIVLLLAASGCGSKSKEEQANQFFTSQDGSDLRARCNGENKIANSLEGACIDAKPITTGCTADELEAAYPKYQWSETRENLAIDLADGYDIVECGLNEDGAFFSTLYINLVRKKISGDRARLSLKTLEVSLVVKDSVEIDAIRKTLAGKQLLITPDPKYDSLNQTCYQFGELPGKCLRWEAFKNGLGSEKIEHDCDADMMLSFVRITCQDAARDGCRGTDSPVLETAFVEDGFEDGATELKLSTETWSIGTDACASKFSFSDTIKPKLVSSDIKAVYTLGSGYKFETCIRFDASLPGPCQYFEDGKPSRLLDGCDLLAEGYGSLSLKCEGQACKDLISKTLYPDGNEVPFGLSLNLKDATPNDDFTRLTFAGKPESEITIGPGLCNEDIGRE